MNNLFRKEAVDKFGSSNFGKTFINIPFWLYVLSYLLSFGVVIFLSTQN